LSWLRKKEQKTTTIVLTPEQQAKQAEKEQKANDEALLLASKIEALSKIKGLRTCLAYVTVPLGDSLRVIVYVKRVDMRKAFFRYYNRQYEIAPENVKFFGPQGGIIMFDRDTTESFKFDLAEANKKSYSLGAHYSPTVELHLKGKIVEVAARTSQPKQGFDKWTVLAFIVMAGLMGYFAGLSGVHV
jgi:hypothetical protein